MNMDLHERRNLLNTSATPETRRDFIVVLRTRFTWPDESSGVSVRVRYIPDRQLLSIQSLETYLAALAEEAFRSLEAVATVVLDDINNEIVPRWAQITMSTIPQDSATVPGHEVIVEDRQPNWDNPELLSRFLTS